MPMLKENSSPYRGRSQIQLEHSPGTHTALASPRLSTSEQRSGAQQDPSLMVQPKQKPQAAIEKKTEHVQGSVVPKAAQQSGDCLDDLKLAGVAFSLVATPANTGACGIDEAVTIRSMNVSRRQVSFADQPLLNCRFALQFTRWVSESAVPLVLGKMNTEILNVSTGPGYECRGRNGDSSAKLSEHAYGNAVDVTVIATVDGRKIGIAEALNSSSPFYDVLRGLRTTACGYFTTVIGPGANEAHKDHFHFDMGRHGNSDRYRICQ